MSVIRPALFCFASALALSAAGCAGISKDGPTSGAVRSGAVVSVRNPEAVGYLLVDLSGPTMAAANDGTMAATLRFSGLGGGVGPDVSVGVGDILSVTIFESEAGGLFVPKEAGSRSGNFVQIPNQQVDAAGNITVPYIEGPVHVVGRTTRSISAEIASKLKNRAVEPQAVVSVVEHRANDVSVLGELTAPTQFSIDPGGVKLLNAIARAGGPKYPDYETTVSIQRNGVTHRAWLSAIIKDPAQNVSLRPRDVVYLGRDQKVFLTLGATPSPGAVGGVNNRRFPFDNANMTLAEAVAKAGGLDTSRADPKAVFLYRLESKRTLAEAGLDTSRFPGPVVPTVYRSNLAQGGGFFLANSFLMRDKDILFVSEDPSVEINRFMTILASVTNNAANVAGTVADVQSIAHGGN